MERRSICIYIHTYICKTTQANHTFIHTYLQPLAHGHPQELFLGDALPAARPVDEEAGAFHLQTVLPCRVGA
jgi:hypothetical protein